MNQSELKRLGVPLPFVFLLCVGYANSIAGEPPTPFWDRFPRIVESSSLSKAVDLHATIAMNAAQNDPSWGLFGQKVGSQPKRTEQFRRAGLKSISYYETFGQSYCYVGELPDDTGGNPGALPGRLKTQHWGWSRYRGGPVVWVGVHNYFDDEPFARPFTRTHPSYGSPPATYPDGTVATGYDRAAADPRNSRVFDAICAKDILGRLRYETKYNARVNRNDSETGKPAGPLDGLQLIPETGKYAGLFLLKKDAACPAWIDYARASTRMAASAGLDGMWTDNFSPWDSFGQPPVTNAFGEWSVARFRDYLKEHFSREQLRAMEIDDVGRFDVRRALVRRARQWGWKDDNLKAAVWRDPRWQEEPLWRAYVIFKRQTGTEALARYYRTVKEAARQAGKVEFLVAGNDIPGYSLGWPRGELDMVSTELSTGWNLAAGPRGFMLPPVGRFAPFYKLAREHARSRFVNVWLYRDGHEEELVKPNVISVIYYEMLSTHALPMFHPSSSRSAGTPAADREFFEFVARVAPEYADRVPVETIGIYYSSSSLLTRQLPGGTMTFGRQPHQFAFWGWATALGQLHRQYKAVPEWKLNRDALAHLRLLVIPDAEVFDPAVVQQVLLPWVRDEGGLLVVTGATGRRLGESDNFRINPAGLSLAPLTGMKQTGVGQTGEAPGEKVVEIGKGRVVYLRDNLGLAFYMKDNQPDRDALLPRFRKIVDRALTGRAASVIVPGDGVSGCVGLTLYEQAERRRLFIDVNNLAVDPQSDCIEESGPIEFSVRLPEWLRQSDLTARALAPESTPAVRLKRLPHDRLLVTLDSVRFYAGVVISPDPKQIP